MLNARDAIFLGIRKQGVGKLTSASVDRSYFQILRLLGFVQFLKFSVCVCFFFLFAILWNYVPFYYVLRQQSVSKWNWKINVAIVTLKISNNTNN